MDTEVYGPFGAYADRLVAVETVPCTRFEIDTPTFFEAVVDSQSAVQRPLPSVDGTLDGGGTDFGSPSRFLPVDGSQTFFDRETA